MGAHMARLFRRRLPALMVLLSVALAACGQGASSGTPPPIRLGALFPLQSVQASLASDEYLGMDIDTAQAVAASAGVAVFGLVLILLIRRQRKTTKP